MAVLALLPLDVLAAQPETTRAVFGAVYGDGLTLSLNALALLHVVGGVLIGVALVRSRLLPRWLAVVGAAVLRHRAELAG
jgi:hypothetical protein